MITNAVSHLFDALKQARWQQWGLVLIACVCALGLRRELVPTFTTDYTDFMQLWIDTLRKEGFHAFATDFADYNPPYLYLLYIGSRFPIHGLTIIKIYGAIFDTFLAVGVGALLYRVRRNLFVAVIAAAAALYIPEVFLNSAFWGQVDVTYASFLVWSAFFLVGRQSTPAWIFFAIALSFKLQAIFFLPWIIFAFIIQRHRWRSVLVGLVV
ncbi:MAG: hypothetical protein QOH44_2406, partial [Actinomycetota bacterium]|nr:hypothetical protein [Actinomycetota bacterium]